MQYGMTKTYPCWIVSTSSKDPDSLEDYQSDIPLHMWHNLGWILNLSTSKIKKLCVLPILQYHFTWKWCTNLSIYGFDVSSH